MAGRWELTDEQWELWEPVLRPARRADRRGRPWHDTRAVLNGVLWVLGTGAQWALALVDVAAAVIGLTAAFAIWRDTSDSKRWVSPFLEHVWYWDNFYDAIIGRPLIRAAKFSDDVVEPDVIDGAVTGVAVGIRDSAESLRKIQSGFVRQYALAMVLGFAVIIVYLLARVH